MGVYELLEALAPLAGVAKVLVRFGRNPFGFIATIISLYIVNGFLNLGAFAVNTVLSAFDIVVGSLDFVRITLVNAFGGIGIDLLGAIAVIQQVAGNVIATAGPAAPVLAVGLAGLSVWIGWEVAKRTPKALYELYMLIPGT